mmetsp:Transcript_51879/g.144802  ORF Transcript_51879/g.144802 Transcript_51879/m.144802 type:complete len:226 (+) Transcript_51879:376-1053(+)
MVTPSSTTVMRPIAPVSPEKLMFVDASCTSMVGPLGMRAGIISPIVPAARGVATASAAAPSFAAPSGPSADSPAEEVVGAGSPPPSETPVRSIVSSSSASASSESAVKCSEMRSLTTSRTHDRRSFRLTSSFVSTACLIILAFHWSRLSRLVVSTFMISSRSALSEGIEGAADPPIDAKSSIVLRWVVLVRYLLGLDPLTASSTSDPPDPAASSSLATTVVRGIA